MHSPMKWNHKVVEKVQGVWGVALPGWWFKENFRKGKGLRLVTKKKLGK